MSNEWKQITKEEIKRVPVDTPITVNGVEGVLHSHYGSMDYGFDYRHTSAYYPFTRLYKLFKNSDWENTEVLVKLPAEGHPYADLMAEYAEIAKTNPAPWLEFEAKYYEDEWATLTDNPTWSCSINYRRKTKTIDINGNEVPEPIRTVPEDGTEYWLASTLSGPISRYWTDAPAADSQQGNHLVRGLMHYSLESCEKHVEALRSFTKEGTK